MPLIIKKHIIMYARKYYLIIYIRNLIPEYTSAYQQQYSRTCQHPHLFLRKVTFDLLTFWPFCHSLHTPYSSNSPRSPFTSFTYSLSHHSPFHFHLFTFSSRLSLPYPSYLHLLPFLSTSQHPGQRLKKTGTTLSFLAKMY